MQGPAGKVRVLACSGSTGKPAVDFKQGCGNHLCFGRITVASVWTLGTKADVGRLVRGLLS